MASIAGIRPCGRDNSHTTRLKHSSSPEQGVFIAQVCSTRKRPRWSGIASQAQKNAEASPQLSPPPPPPQQQQSLLSFLCPLLKLIGNSDPSAPRNVPLETATSGIASLARLPWGKNVNTEIVSSRTRQPLQLFKLYEFEACPFCRRVREALTELDLSAEVYPCPKGSRLHRPFVKAAGGKEQFPYFIDPNTGVTMYESSDIVKYLFEQYGEKKKPTFGILESTIVTGWVPTLMRAGRGMSLWDRALPDPPGQLLELYSYENNQFARLVREALCELELPYVLWNAGKGSIVSSKLKELSGSTQVPYLVDPNTGKQMAESQDIVRYLFSTYGTSEQL